MSLIYVASPLTEVSINERELSRIQTSETEWNTWTIGTQLARSYLSKSDAHLIYTIVELVGLPRIDHGRMLARTRIIYKGISKQIEEGRERDVVCAFWRRATDIDIHNATEL